MSLIMVYLLSHDDLIAEILSCEIRKSNTPAQINDFPEGGEGSVQVSKLRSAYHRRKL